MFDGEPDIAESDRGRGRVVLGDHQIHIVDGFRCAIGP
jgi:hypothetical protein